LKIPRGAASAAWFLLLQAPHTPWRSITEFPMTDPGHSPFHDYLSRLHRDLSDLDDGTVADYIPELAKAAPARFGLAFATTDGAVYSVGDCREPFSIQSVSKPFAYGGALMQAGAEAVLKKVGVAPTGEAFNAIVLDERNNRPFNPMVNAGAIAIAAMAPGDSTEDRRQGMYDLFSRFAGRQLDIDEDVYRSEAATGHRNRAIAYLMLNSGMIDRPPEEVLDLYFRQCALRITVEDLAIMGAVLAKGGVHPVTGERILNRDAVRDVLTLMMTCGMYDYAGEWSYEVGLPAKSGVSGAVLAILPGQISVAIWSPPLDEIGNSVRGLEACRRISRDFGLHLLSAPDSVEEVIRRMTRGDTQRSRRIRAPRDRDHLVAEGQRTVLAELQGQLHFASTERLLRRLDSVLDDTDHLILDMRRIVSIDAAARRFFRDFVSGCPARGCALVFADLPRDRPDATEGLAEIAAQEGVAVFDSVDAALESRENALLEALRDRRDVTRFALEEIGLFAGLEAAGRAELEARIEVMQFEAGEVILRRGTEGHKLFAVARGAVSIWIGEQPEDRIRVGCIGPGQFFGEIAALGGGARSADAVADERVVCYALSSDALADLARSHPQIMAVLLGNMAGEFGDRIRQANRMISALR
jgi:glutaminase